ncbi:MAG: ParB/RepB/Spo0J family partition protein [Chloroflexi bacterium]|nr:ParB/RepB/Spo0J family partition protein [Chloroflexota bacterium]
MAKKRQINTSPLDSIGAELDFLNADPSERFNDNSLKVEYISAQLIRPDAAQPRRVLPERIYWEFHNEQLTPTQALREFIQDVQIISRQKGRPFQMVLDLLPVVEETEEEIVVNFTPEEQLLRDLINLASTIRDDGQVNPLTVVDCSQGVAQQYRIETGERRYWATWLLMDFLPGYQGDGSIPCIIIPSKRASVFRQAKENTSRSGLNAIAMARQAALLILTVYDIHPPEGPVTNDFYRQALDYDLRAKREYTEDILAAMGGIGRAYLSRYKALLALSDEAIEIADRHCIDEGKLRHVLHIEPIHHAEVVRQIIDFNLNARQVKELCMPNQDKEPKPYKPPRHALKFARAVLKGNSGDIHEIAEALLLEEEDKDVIRLRLQNFVRSAEEYLSNQ